MKLLRYKGLYGSIESSEDGHFIGKVEFVPTFIRFKADNPEALENAFHRAVDLLLERCKRRYR